MSPEKTNETSLKIQQKVIVVVDDSERFLNSCLMLLRSRGFRNIKCVSNVEAAMKALDNLSPDLFLVDIHLNQENDGLELLKTVRMLGYRGLAVVISGDGSMEQCFRAAKAGANDFLLKRPTINIADEIIRVFQQEQNLRQHLAATRLSELGYLRSFGLTKKEIQIVEELAKDYESQKIIADRLDTAPVQLRKAFTRIYKKLDVDGLGQLIHLLTVCSMFDIRG